MKSLFRIEHPSSNKGMWNTYCEKGLPLVTYLSNEVMATLPMPHSDVYGEEGRRWYSSVDSIEDLHSWFNPNDIQELIDLGFKLYKLEVTEYKHLEKEIIFTKESLTKIEDVTEHFILKIIA